MKGFPFCGTAVVALDNTGGQVVGVCIFKTEAAARASIKGRGGELTFRVVNAYDARGGAVELGGTDAEIGMPE